MGGIGTGTISLSGRGALVDWETNNRPAKSVIPTFGKWAPHFAVRVKPEGSEPLARVLEGPVTVEDYEGDHGCTVPNHGLPHFQKAVFKAAYPLAQVELEDSRLPLSARLEAFNPLVPGDADASGIPAVLLRWRLRSEATVTSEVSVVGTLIGDGVRLFLPDGLGTVSEAKSVSSPGWNIGLDRYWRRFVREGVVRDTVPAEREMTPVRQKCVSFRLAPGEEKVLPFVLAWRSPDRKAWNHYDDRDPKYVVGNWYAVRYPTVETVAEDFYARLPDLEAKTVAFVRRTLAAKAPDVVKEAALFNLSTLRTETCFRTADGRFFGWEGCYDSRGSCPGNCSHVWGYEHALVDLWPELAKTMSETYFVYGMDSKTGGIVNRVALPLDGPRVDPTNGGGTVAAADGQMQCLVKACEIWKKTGDDAWLAKLWPKIRKAMEFCWIEGGWDGDGDGVMEGCQHNTMDVEYYGPNPQMEFLYLAALEAVAQMADKEGDHAFAAKCRDLKRRGSAWTEANLFNGRYYEHRIVPPKGPIAEGLRDPRMGARDLSDPDFQLGSGCLIDQLLGDFSARAAGLPPVADPAHAAATLETILERCRVTADDDRHNFMRSFTMPGETSLRMAWYDEARLPRSPFPYATETMTGFEYVVAALLAWNGEYGKAERVVRDIRDRYDGIRRNPFDEAECGHHYSRALSSWSVFKAFAARGETRASVRPEEWPLVVVRQAWGIHNEPKTFGEQMDVHGRYPGACDETWFESLLYRPAKLEDIVRETRGLEALRPACERNGVVLAYQQGQTLGHSAGHDGEPPAGAKRFEKDDFRVSRDGNRLDVLCPRSANVLAYEYEYVKGILEGCHPASYWIDDDLRVGVGFWRGTDGCFCDRCLKLFNARMKTSFAREELVGRLFGDREIEPLCKAWAAFNAEGLAAYAAEARRAADEVMPECRLGYQAIWPDVWYNGRDFLPLLKALSGKDGRRVGIRPGACYYTEQDLYGFVSKALGVAREAERCKDYGNLVATVCYEEENYPRRVLHKSPGAIVMECALAMASGADSISLYWYAPTFPEPLEDYERFVRATAEARPYYELLSDLAKTTRLGGVARYLGEHCLEQRGFDLRDPTDLFLCLNGVPVTVEESGTRVCYLTEKSLKAMSDRDWRRLAGYGALVGKSDYGKFCKGNADAEALVRSGKLAVVPDFVEYPIAAERTAYLDALDRVTDGRFPVRVDRHHRLRVLPRVDEDGRLAAVSVLNCSIGKSDAIPVRLRRPVGTVARWCRPGAKPVDVKLTRGTLPDEWLCVLPELSGWEIGTLVLERREIVCEGVYGGHLQGVATDGTNIYWSFTVEVVKTDLKGRLLATTGKVPSHHGDLCVRDGRVYVAVNLGKFNYENRGDSHVYAYDAKTLAKVGEWPLPECVHGAGGMTHDGNHFFVVGGLPATHEKNYVYEYDAGFAFVRRHELATGFTLMGIQTADWRDGRFLFGIYGHCGNPFGLLVAPHDLSSVERRLGQGNVGLVRLPDGPWTGRTSRGTHRGKTGQRGRLLPAVGQPESQPLYRPPYAGRGEVRLYREGAKETPWKDAGYELTPCGYNPLTAQTSSFSRTCDIWGDALVKAFGVGPSRRVSVPDLIRGLHRAAERDEVISFHFPDDPSDGVTAARVRAIRDEAARLGMSVRED